MFCFRLLGLALLALHLVWVEARAEEDWGNGLMGKLLESGIQVGAEPFTLSKPSADPVISADEREAAQRGLAGNRGWAAFVRRSVVAPVQMELDSLRAANGQRVGQRVHFAFVAHANVATLRDRDAMRAMFAGEAEASQRDGFHSEVIHPSDRARLGIDDSDPVTYGLVETILLNKISLTGVIGSERVDRGDGFVLAWQLDERFTDHEPTGENSGYRNAWSKLERDPVGKPIRGPAQPYSGAAGYLVVSALSGVEGASLIEGEVVLHEPDDWFSGSNLLRSKLPLIIQESARKLRRGLE